MADALRATPQTSKLDSGLAHSDALAERLKDVLADTYRLIFKTHSYHWNVTGPLFYPIHKMTETQYENLFAAADTLAERVRALGHLAPLQLLDLTERSEITDLSEAPSARTMVEDLAKDHENIARRLRHVVELAGDCNDPVTDDIATARIAFHEEAIWMLRATADT